MIYEEKKYIYISIIKNKKIYAIFHAFDITVQYGYIDWLISRSSNSLKKAISRTFHVDRNNKIWNIFL